MSDTPALYWKLYLSRKVSHTDSEKLSKARLAFLLTFLIAQAMSEGSWLAVRDVFEWTDVLADFVSSKVQGLL